MVMAERGKLGDQARPDSYNIIGNFISTLGPIRNVLYLIYPKATFLVIVLYPLIITFYT